MIERALSDRTSPKTQSIDAVKALLAWKKVSSDPLPEFVEMDKEDLRLVLVLSNKRDCYYVTTARACSCPAAIYNPGKRCKHSRKYFPQIAEADIKAMLPGWPGGFNGPVEA